MSVDDIDLSDFANIAELVLESPDEWTYQERLAAHFGDDSPYGLGMSRIAAVFFEWVKRVSGEDLLRQIIEDARS